jgi:hypothetical protein|tara:strand:+ start:1182 stop:1541 length:360 start_codon:yes stop_codon:yes gene_type:complete
LQEDVTFATIKDIKREIDCKSCDGTAQMTFRNGNTIHQTNSSMYGQYHGGFGCVVESYSHKQQLLKKYNVVESSDPVGGSRCHRKSENDLQKTKVDGPQWSFGGTPAEAMQAAQQQMEE